MWNVVDYKVGCGWERDVSKEELLLLGLLLAGWLALENNPGANSSNKHINQSRNILDHLF